MKFDPTIIPLDEVANRLTPGPMAQHLPVNWTCGIIPIPALPIDEFIEVLLSGKRRLQIRPSTELLAFSAVGGCPFAVARAGTADAFVYALISATRDSTLKQGVVDALKATKNLGPLVSANIADLYREVQFVLEASQDFEVDLPDLAKLANALSYTNSLLARLLPRVDQSHAFVSQNAGHPWRIAFVTSLFGAWWRLTGRDPQKSGPFADFVEAAWQSLSAKTMPAVEWESAIVTAKRRADYGWRVQPI